MKGKWMVLLGGVVVILLMNFQLVAAAPPAGEVKTAGSMFGNQTPIPYLETSHGNDYMQLLYDQLVGCTPEGTYSPDLGLAHKWEMSPDGLTWTFYLRKGVKFHDGVELTAKDVKFSLEQMMRPEVSDGVGIFLRKALKSVEIKDPYAVILRCKSPDIFLLSFLSNGEGTGGMVVPKDYYEKVGKDEFFKRPIGSGPYKFHSQSVGSFIKLEATERHWRDGVPKYKYMTYLIIPEESTRLAMLKTGEADISRISRESVKDAMNAGLNIVNKEMSGVIVFRPNMQWTSPVFSDIRFRKALNLAIDKQAIITRIFSGMSKPVAMYPGTIASVFGADTTLKPYPYDPQEASRLIKQGGWEGYEFTMPSYDRAGCPEFQGVVETIAGYWEKAGLKPKIRVTEWSVWRKAWRSRKCENTIHGADSSISPDIGLLVSNFRERLDFRVLESAVNIPELTQKFERIERSLDIREVSRLLAEIYRYAYDHHLAIPICELTDKIATTPKIPKWDPGIRSRDRNYNDLIKQR